MFLVALFIAVSGATEPLHALSKIWATGVAVTEQHHAYVSGDVLKQPAGTWQHLYSVVRATAPGAGLVKDCVWVRVPANQDGALKVVTVAPSEPCADSWERAGWLELGELRAIQFAVDVHRVKFWVTEKSGRVVQAKAELLNMRTRTAPLLHDSSVPPRVLPGVFLFAPNSSLALAPTPKLTGELKDEYPSTPCSWDDGSCARCRWGVYRVRNGRAFDFYCGVERCGQKNAPACDRGVTWPRIRKDFSCRTDQSYALCAPGLTVECVGEQAVCR